MQEIVGKTLYLAGNLKLLSQVHSKVLLVDVSMLNILGSSFTSVQAVFEDPLYDLSLFGYLDHDFVLLQLVSLMMFICSGTLMIMGVISSCLYDVQFLISSLEIFPINLVKE
jgi:hypothetical protein